jgi:hypothetical protein
VYPDARVARFVTERFIPARVHVKEQPDDYRRLGERFGAQWTPTLLVIDPSGTERHRIEGFLPADDLIAQLALGLGHSAFARAEWGEAERRFREVADRHAGTDAGAEAQYWTGVARYKGTNDAGALAETARAFAQRYQDTPWAKKASVWAR